MSRKAALYFAQLSSAHKRGHRQQVFHQWLGKCNPESLIFGVIPLQGLAVGDVGIVKIGTCPTHFIENSHEQSDERILPIGILLVFSILEIDCREFAVNFASLHQSFIDFREICIGEGKKDVNHNGFKILSPVWRGVIIDHKGCGLLAERDSVQLTHQVFRLGKGCNCLPELSR